MTRKQAKDASNINYDTIKESMPDNTSFDNFNDSKKKSHNSIQKLTDSEEIKAVLKMFHNGPLGGHQGIKKTINRIRKQYTWDNLSKDVENTISSCDKCHKNIFSRETKMPLIITDTATKPFEKVYLDIVCPLKVTERGNEFILTFKDDLTKFFDCYALPDAKADTVAKCF